MRVHGRSGVAYLGLNYGDAASPVAFLSGWTVDYVSTVFDITVVTDVQHVYGAGFPDASGSFAGFFDTATAQSYASAVDGLPRNMCLYPAASGAGPFFSGQVLPDYSLGGGVTAAVALSVTWSATGPFTRITPSSPVPAAGTASGAALSVTVITSGGTVSAPAALAAASGTAPGATAAGPGSVSAPAGLAAASGSAPFVPGSAVSLTLTALSPVGAAGTAPGATASAPGGVTAHAGLAAASGWAAVNAAGSVYHATYAATY